MGEVFRNMSRTGLGIGASDITCGLKGFCARAGRDIFSRARVNGWAYDAEILVIAKTLDLTLHEVPITWFHSQDSAVRVGSAALESLRDMARIFWWSKTNGYR